MPLSAEIDILTFEEELRKTYERYTYSANLISDHEPELQDAFVTCLNKDFSVFNGPFMHSTPNYRPLCSLQELTVGFEGIRLAPGMTSFPSEQFDPKRPLYSHQVEGYYVIQFRKRKDPDPLGFGSEEKRIKQSLLEQKKTRVYQAFLEQIRSKSEITIKEGFLE